VGYRESPDSLRRILKCYDRINYISNSNLLHNENLSAEPLQVGNYEKLLTTLLNVVIRQLTLSGRVYGKENFNGIFKWLVVVEPHTGGRPPLIVFIN